MVVVAINHTVPYAKTGMKRKVLQDSIKNNALSIALFSLFALFLIGLSITGYYEQNEERQSHQQTAISYGAYVTSGNFVEAIFENWESEFLQMWALVMLTIFLKQRGSADSKKLHGQNEVDTSSRYTIIHAQNWKSRSKAVGHLLRDNSLGLALLSLFAVSFVLHAVGGLSAYNEEAKLHGEQVYTLAEYITSSRFWFESFQNWQSEFLAVGSLLVLSIFLRQRGSPESKPVGTPNAITGS